MLATFNPSRFRVLHIVFVLLAVAACSNLSLEAQAALRQTLPNSDAMFYHLLSLDGELGQPDCNLANRTNIPIDEIHAGGCFDYSGYSSEVASIASGTETTWIEQVGPITIVGEYSGRLLIFDLSDPYRPEPLFEMQYSFESRYDHISCLAARDTVLFVGKYMDDSRSNFDIFSIANPSQPQLLQSANLYLHSGVYTYQLAPLDCWIDSDCIYVLGYGGNSRRGFWILENHNGIFHHTIDGVWVSGARSFVIEEGLVYFCFPSGRISVFDARNHAQFPAICSLEFDEFRPVHALAEQSFLYVADTYGKLGTFDISDPDMEPQLVRQADIGCNSGRLNLKSDGTLQVAISAQGIVDLDISDPANPTMIRNYTLPGGGGDLANGPDNTILAATNDGVWILTPEEANGLPESLASGWNTRSVSATGGLIYCGEGGYFRIYQPEPGGQVQLLGEVELPLVATRIFTDNRIAVVDERFFVIDDQVEILNVSDPTNPSVLMTLPIENGSDQKVDTAFSGNFVFLTKSGLWVFDTSDIANPALIHEVPREIYNIEILNDVGYVLASSTSDYLEVFDLTDPYNIEAVASLDLDGSLNAMAATGNTVYVGQKLYDGYTPIVDCIVIVDVSRADCPQVIDSVSVSNDINDLRIVGDFLYAGTDDGVKIFDITQRDQPDLVGQVLGSYIPQISVQDDILFQVINYHLVTVPAHCQGASFVTIDTGPPDGLMESILSLSLRPNPFNPRVTVSFSLEHSDEISVAVFDVRGQLVQVLNEGILAPGSHSFVWNGRDRQDRYMPSGNYFFKVSTSVGEVTCKGLLLQ